MPVFTSGSPLQVARAEYQRNLGGQIDSLTFFERAAPRGRLGSTANPLGLLLTSATSSLFFAGESKRTVPRFNIGSYSGREFQQEISISGGDGQVNLAFNPALPLHRELRNPPRNSDYHVVSVMAPPFMNMAAAILKHTRSGNVEMDPDQQPQCSVTFLDNFGGVHVPSRLYQSESVIVTGRTAAITFNDVPGADNETLVIGKDSSNDDVDWEDSSGGDLHVNVDGGTGEIEMAQISAGENLGASGTNGYDTLILMMVPGNQGGYVVTGNLSSQNFGVSGGFTLDTDTELARRIVANPDNAMYLGVYSTPEQNLLFRS